MADMWKAATPIELHCTGCGALPDEGCRNSAGRSVPPHPERMAAYDANRRPVCPACGESHDRSCSPCRPKKVSA